MNDLAQMIVQSLRDVPRRRIRPVACSHEETAIRRDREAASGLGAEPFGRHCGLGSKDDFRIAQGAFGFVQPAPRDIRIAVCAIDVIEKAEKDPVVSRIMRIKHHVEQANILCAGCCQLGHTGHPLREHTLAVQDAQAAGQSFGEENFPARQKCETPWRGHVVDQRRNVEGR